MTTAARQAEPKTRRRAHADLAEGVVAALMRGRRRKGKRGGPSPRRRSRRLKLGMFGGLRLGSSAEYPRGGVEGTPVLINFDASATDICDCLCLLATGHDGPDITSTT